MKAILETRCGCRREADGVAGHTIVVPMMHVDDYRAYGRDGVSNRRFKLSDTDKATGLPLYREEPLEKTLSDELVDLRRSNSALLSENDGLRAELGHARTRFETVQCPLCQGDARKLESGGVTIIKCECISGATLIQGKQ